jgi:hypothetical protein
MVELGESQVPLEKSVFDETRDFFPTWAEWASDNNRSQVIISTDSLVGTSVIYTVPQKHNLFITSAFITFFITTPGSQHENASIEILEAGNAIVILSTSVDHEAGGGSSGSNSLSYPMPLLIQENTSIQISSFRGEATAGFQGFLVPKRIS